MEDDKMKKTMWIGISTVIIFSLLLAACSSSNAQVTNTPGAASTANMPGATSTANMPGATSTANMPGATSTANTPALSSDLLDLGGREIIVAEGNDTPPFCYIDTTTNKPTGFDYDFFPALCTYANCKAVFKEFSWDGVFEAGVAGEWDITLWGIAETIDRAKIVDFTAPIVTYVHQLVVRADSPYTDVNSFVADSKAMIGAVPGSAEELNAESLVGTKRIHNYETFDLPPLAVKSGDIDGFISVNFVTNTIMRDNPGIYKVIGTTNTPSYIAAPIRPGSLYETAFNAAIRKMWADGTMEKLQKKWGLMAP
jgi:polar amino acid transport system substrate-binding protein